MDQRTPAEVLTTAPEQQARAGDSVDRVGQDVVALLQKAAKSSNEKVEHAVTVTRKLSMQLRDAQDRIAQLEGQNALLHDEVEHLQRRAARAEGWLERIKREIEDNLVGSQANRP